VYTYIIVAILTASPCSYHVSTPIVGQSLGLNCLVNTVSGITSRITVAWISCGKVLSSTSITQGTSNIRYTISQLSTADEGKVYQCEVVISTIPPVRAIGLITLNVNSKFIPVVCILMYVFS